MARYVKIWKFSRLGGACIEGARLVYNYHLSFYNNASDGRETFSMKPTTATFATFYSVSLPLWKPVH